MRVFCFIDSLGGGGAQRQLAGLAVGLKQRGHEVRFLVYHPADYFGPLLGKANIAVERLRPCSPCRRVREVRRVLRQGWQDVVLAFLDGPSLYAELAGLPARNWGLVVGERLAFPGLHRSRAKWLRWPHRFADAVVTNSHTCRLLLEETWPGLGRKIVTVYNATDLAVFRPMQHHEPPGDPPAELRIVVAASYQEKKNMLGVAQALDQLSAKPPRSRVVVDWFGIPGPDPAVLAQAKDFVARRQLGDRLRFHAATGDIAREYQAADAVGLFSFYEGLPNVVCEGIACGKPILMSDTCDAGNLVAEGVNGVLCEPHSPASIAEALRRFATLTPEARRAMGEASRQKAQALFAPDTILDHYEQILEAAAARNPPPPGSSWPEPVPASASRTIAQWSGAPAAKRARS